MLQEVDLTNQTRAEIDPQRSPALWVRYSDISQEYLAEIISICVSGFSLDKKPEFSPFNLEGFKAILNPPHAIEWRPLKKKGYLGDGLDIVRLEGVRNQIFVRFKAVGKQDNDADKLDPQEVKVQKQIDSYLDEKLPGRTFAVEQVIAHEIFLTPLVHVEETQGLV